MKKMIAVYALQLILIAVVALIGHRLTQHLAIIESELAGVRREQLKDGIGLRSPFGSVLRVQIENEPTVHIDEPVDVNVSDTLDVNVVNSPEVNCN